MSRMIIIIMQWSAEAETEAAVEAEAKPEENPPMRMPVVRHLGALMCHNECIRESAM